MCEPLNNRARRVFWSCIPLGIVVWFFQKYVKAHDSMGNTVWSRVWSSYSEKYSGAVVLIRKRKVNASQEMDKLQLLTVLCEEHGVAFCGKESVVICKAMDKWKFN